MKYLFLTIVLLLSSTVTGDICELNVNSTIDCPGENDEPNFTKCCRNENVTEEVFCCANTSLENNDRLVMLVSLSVILSCLSISVLTVICCFWSRCPLFDSCSVNYTRRGIIAYTKEEEALNQPPDENEYCNQYTPVNVKISKVDDV